MNILEGAAVVGQSGGPTAAINATLAGVIKGALENQSAIKKIYGMKNGIEGLLKKNLVDLGSMFSANGEIDDEKITDLSHTPSAFLGSCRKKLPEVNGNSDFYENLIAIFKEFNIRYFFYIGGNDSMDTVTKLTEYLKTHDYEMCVIGLCKTIDNDLVGTDHTPGYGSAAKYIAVTVQEIVRDCAVYKVPAVTIVEIMGRDAGWLTAAAALPRIVSGECADLVYLPETVFSMENFLADVKNELAKKPNVVVAVSEGIRLADGTYVGEGAQSGTVDVFGHKYLAGTGRELEMFVKNEIGCKVRSVELNISQRCAAHILSLADITESFGVGCEGIKAAISVKTGCMIAIVRNEGEDYSVSYEAKEIAGIANKIKYVPSEFINEAGNNVTDDCLRHILPLIAGEPQIKYKNGLPYHVVLR